MQYFVGSGAEALDREFEKLKNIAYKVEKLPKGFYKSSLPIWHGKAGAVGGMYFLIEFAAANNMKVLKVAITERDQAETIVREFFEDAWAHQDKPVLKMKSRFRCEIAVGYRFMWDSYKKKFPDVGFPDDIKFTADGIEIGQCKTGDGLFKNITKKLPPPP